MKETTRTAKERRERSRIAMLIVGIPVISIVLALIGLGVLLLHGPF